MQTTKAVVKPVRGDEFDLMNRKKLTAYAKDNRTCVLVRPSLLVDDIRNQLRIWQEDEILRSEEGYEKSVQETAVQLEVISHVKRLASKERLVELREKHARLTVKVAAPVSSGKPKAAILP